MSYDPKVWATRILDFLFGWMRQKICPACGGSGYPYGFPNVTCARCEGKGWIR